MGAIAPLQAIATTGQLVAIGTSGGVVLAIQMPPPQPPATAHGAPPAAKPTLWHLGEAKSGGETEAVTALAFSTVASAGDALWLAAGHASGALGLWEVTKRGARQVATIGGWRMHLHARHVCACAAVNYTGRAFAGPPGS